jgi:alkylation response protein AidB-like acyl-CoA dehydrogenase
MSGLRHELRSAVAALEPIVDDDRRRADERGYLGDAVVTAATEHGLFRTRVPESLGGRDLSLVEQLALSEAVAYLDGSTGWTISFMALSAGLVAGHVPDAGAAAILDSGGGGWPRFAGTFPTTGVATRAEGGWVIGGRWGFASGVHHASWIAVGARLAGSDPDDRSASLWAALPVAHAEIMEDSWNVDGLRATGSCTFTLRDTLVPDSMVFSVLEAKGRGRPIHAQSTLVFISPEHAGIALGLARRALDEVTALAHGKARMGGRAPLHSRGAFLRDLGRADTQLRAARAHIVDRLQEADGAAVPLPPRYVADVRAAAAHVAETAVDVATLAYRYAGGSAIARDHPLHRAWRDVVTATQHVHTNDENYETWGEAISGSRTSSG